MKTIAHCATFLLLSTAAAFAQVRVDAHLERSQPLQGEPVVVVVDVLNIGSEPVGYQQGSDGVRLTVVSVRRRTPPNIFGCYSGVSSGSGGGTGLARLEPGQTTSFRYLLQEYDLSPGQYSVSVSGNAGRIQWYRKTDSVPGAEFEQALSLRVAPATNEELQRAFAARVSNADSTDSRVRYEARAEIIESAPVFLEPLIARFAEENPFNTTAIDALGRIATADSRSHLNGLFRSTRDMRRSAAMLALARIGHPVDAAFFTSVLEDSTSDETSRRYAALGLGHIGGVEAVHRLEQALSSSAELRPAIATALGNTHSSAAVPVLISMFGNNPSRNEVCGALLTLTHRSGCDGSGPDPACARRQLLRKWNQEAATSATYGIESCPEPESPGAAVPGNSQPVAAIPATEKTPTVTSVTPTVAFPGAVVTLSGEARGMEDLQRVRVVFKQGDIEHQATATGGGGIVGRDPDAGVQYIDVVVPDSVTSGRWQIVVEVGGRRSAPLPIDVTTARSPVVTRVSPARPHPSQWVS